MPVPVIWQAIVRDGTGVRLAKRPEPRPGLGEIVLAPEQVSLCGTDIQILRRLRDDPSPIVGHEGLARVVAVGVGSPDANDLAPGMRVIVNPTHPHDPSFLLGHNVEGLFQQRVTISASAVRSGLVLPVPDDLDAAIGTLIEPLAVTRYALACLGAVLPATLVIYGDGLIGNLAALVARRYLSPAVHVVLRHRKQPGRTWSEAHLPSHVRHIDGTPQSDTSPDFPAGPIAVLLATPRDATVSCLEHAVATMSDRLAAVHLVGGLFPGATTAALPGVDLNGVRVANTGGPWPPAQTVAAAGGRLIAVTGNRGVDGAQLLAAADELRRDPTPRVLLTHRLALAEGVDVMNRIVRSGSRMVDGRLVVRLVIDMGHQD